MARSMVLYLMLLQRQTVFSPRTTGCVGCSSVSVIAWPNMAGRSRLPDARMRAGAGGNLQRWELPRQRRDGPPRSRATDFRTLHRPDGKLPELSRQRVQTRSLMRLRGALVLSLVTLSLPAALANTITINGLGDVLATNAVCTLREAIINANNNAATWPDCAAGSGADVINLPAGTITTGERLDGRPGHARMLLASPEA